MTQTRRLAKSAAIVDSSLGQATTWSRWIPSAEPLTPPFVGGHGGGRLSSVTSTATYVQPSELSTAEGIYENSDADDLDDVMDDAKQRFQKQQQHRGSCSSASSRNVRRWKVNELLSTPPRLIRKIKNAVDATTTSDNQHGHRKLVTSRSAEELTGSKSTKVLVEPPPPRRAEASRFSYIYGSVSDDDLADSGGDRSSKLETLDRLIPVYEEFKSATARPTSTSSQRISGHYYASIDDLDDEPNKQLYDVERRAPSVVYEVAAALPDVDSLPTASQQPDDDEVDGELLAADPTDSFPCPICEELSSVSLEENDASSRCAYVDAMHELIVSQAVDARTCGNCTADAGRRTASWRCLDCRHDLCGPCHDAHTSLRLRHRVVSIAALQTGKHQSEISAALAMPCRHHADRDATSLCLDCGCVVCGQCRRDGEPHAGHRVTEQLGDVAARQRDFIGTLLDDTSRRLNELKDNGRVIADYQKPFETEIETVVSAINAQRDNVVRLVDEFCAGLIARVKQEYEFEKDNVRDLNAALERTCSRVEHSSKFARQLIEHGRPVDVVTLSPVVRASLLAAARASPVPIDAKLVVNFRPRALDVNDVEPIVGSVDVDRVPPVDSGTKDSKTTVGSVNRQTRSRRRPGTTSSHSRDSGPPTTPTAAVEPNLSERGSAVNEPVLLLSFPARTPTDSKGCKPTAVAVASCDDDSTLIAVVDDINKKVKVFDDVGQLQLEICPDGRRRLVDPWDVAVLQQQRPTATTHGGTGRYVVSDRGARDIKMFSASGEFVSSFGPHLSTPWGVCTNAAGQVLVSDSGHRTVFVHDSAGILLFNVETVKNTIHGDRYHLQCPEYVAVSPVNGDIVVTDFQRHSVVVFDKFGRLLTRYSGSDDNAAATLRSGLTDRNRLHYKRTLEVPCGVAVSGADDDGRIYVADYNNRRLVRLTHNGRYDGCFVAAGTSTTQLVQPQALDFAADGRLVVVDRNNVKIFDVGVRPAPPPVEVPGGPGTTATPPVAPTDDGAVVIVSEAKHAAAATKHKASRTGPKPAIPPRPKFLKDLTFTDGSNHQAQRGRTKTSSSAAATTTTTTTSETVTAATSTTPSSTIPRKTTAARQTSNTPAVPHTPTNSLQETEVW